MSVTLFAANALETATTVTVSPAAATGKPITRIYDRIRGLAYQGGSAAETDIDIDLGTSPPAISALALLGHTVTGVTVSIRADTTSPGTTERGTLVATGADALVTFASQTLRYWRIRIPVMASAPTIGELMLGVPRTVTVNPFLDNAGKGVLTNVTRRRSPGGYAYATRLSPSVTTLDWRWSYLTAANLATITAALSESEDGVKHLLVQDEDGVLRWMCWTSTALRPTPVVPHPTIGSEVYELAGVTFEGVA